MKIRVKEVDIDGLKFQIGSLTLDQVDEITTADLDKPEDFRNHVRDTIVMSLNNAIDAGKSDDERWTRERVGSELDLYTFELLHDAVLSHSKLAVIKRQQNGAEPAPGEDSAVSKTLAGS